MLQRTPHSRIFVAPEPVDFRQGIDGLGAVCRQVLGDTPLAGAVSGFRNRDVGLEEPLHLPLLDDPFQSAHGGVGAALGPEAIRTISKLLRGDGAEHLAHGVVDDFVLKRQYPNRPALPLPRGDGDPSARLMALRLRFQPCVHGLAVGLHVLPIRLLRDPIGAHRRTGALAVIGPLQGRHVNHMGQRVKPSLGFALRSVHYLHKVR
jgi:hypothetical protein